MKKTWTMPVIAAERFAANEYVAACGDSGKTYKFTCDETTSSIILGIDVGGQVYIDNGNGVYDDGDKFRSDYVSCGKTHEASADGEFHRGWLLPYNTIFQWSTGNPIEVIVWYGEDGKNTHCTTNLDMTTWETTKS